MKAMVKRTTGFIMGAMMAVSLVGCGSKDTTVTQADGKTSAAAQTEEKAQTAAQSETMENSTLPTISFMVPDYGGTFLSNDGVDQVIEKYEAHTGIHVEWTHEGIDTYTEKLGLTLMDKDHMPMVLTVVGNMPANIVDAARKGAFWDLTPYLEDEEAFPNLSKANRGVLKAFTVEGQIVGIYRSREVGRMGFAYREDWAEKLGLEEPKTPEDVYNMMYAFTYSDPDGNGKDDTYGMAMTKSTQPFDIIQTWFGCGNEWVEQDGQLVPIHMTDEYMEALKWLKKCYDDGLMRKDWVTIDEATFDDITKKGESGCVIGGMDGARRAWDYFTGNNVPSVVDPAKTASMNIVGPINGVTLATSGHNGCFLITKAGAKTEEDVKNCLTYLDRMGAVEMRALADRGLEGVNYTIEDGMIVQDPSTDFNKIPSAGLNQSLPMIPEGEEYTPVVKKSESMLAQEDAYARSRVVAVMNPASGYLVSSSANGEYGADVKQIIDDARTQYVCGQIDEDGLKAAMQQWLDRGGKQIMEEVNQMYQAEMGK